MLYGSAIVCLTDIFSCNPHNQMRGIIRILTLQLRKWIYCFICLFYIYHCFYRLILSSFHMKIQECIFPSFAITMRLGSKCLFIYLFILIFEFYFIYFFIQQVLICHQLFTDQCIHVNPNCPIQHTTIPNPPPLSPLGVHTFVLYVCVSTSALQTSSSVPFFQVPHICVNIRYLFFSF